MNPFAVLNTAIPSSFLHEIAHPALSAALLGVAAPVVKQSWLAGLTALRPAAWNGLADGLLGWIVQALVLGTAAAVATWLMFVALRGRLRPGLQVAFWLVVLVRFVAPDGPQFSWSLASIVSLVTPSMTAAAKPATLAAPAIDDGEWEIIPITAPLLGSGAAPVRRAAPVSVWARVPWRLVLAGAYAAALSLIVARRSVRYARFVRAAGRLPEAAPEISAVVSAICQARGVKRMPCVRVSDAAPAPFVYGFLRPTLVLSGRMLSCPRELEAVVLHEIAHLRRGDLWARGLQCLAGTLLFFWPVVAWVNRRIDLAREHACDEWALRHGQLSPGEYARCLLRAAQGRGAKTVGYAPAAMAANLSHVERRIDMILNTSNPTRGGMLRFLAAGTLLAWSAFVLTGAASTKPLKDDAGKAVVSVKTGDDDVALWEAISDESADSADVQDLHRKILAHIHGALANSGVSNDVHTAILNAIQRVHADGTDNPAPSFLSTLPLINFIGSQQDGDLPGALAGNVLFVQQEMTTDGDGTPLRIAMVRGPGDAARAEFLANHPTADADGDGVLSAAEHNAYLIAQAMSAPAGVLAQYPSSDLNGDGLLSADEVAQLLVAGPMPEGLPGGMKFFRVGGDGSNDVQHTIAFRGAVKTGDADATQSSEQDVFVVKPDNADSNASFSIRLAPQIKADGAVELKVDGQPADVHQNLVFRTRKGDSDTKDADVKITGGVHVFSFNQQIETNDLPVPPSEWIGQNIDVTPTAEQVAEFVPVAEQAPLSAFLRMNPAADADHDGMLTPAERDAFLEQHHIRMSEQFLKLHPEADTDGDGTLSREEMRTFQIDRLGSTGQRKIVLGSPVQISDAPAQGGPLEIELKLDNDAAGPK